MASSPAFPILLVLRRRFATSGPPACALDLFESELVSRLKADPVLAPLVEGRIYPLLVPESSRPALPGRRHVYLPALVYAITSNERYRYLSGPSGIATAEVVFEVRGERYSEVKAIQEALRRYDGFRGVLAEDVRVLMTWFAEQGDDFEWPAGSGGGRGTYHLTLGFRFKYREPTLTL